MNGQSEDDSAAEEENDKAKRKRNEAIFRNMTFDNQGQPIIQHHPNVENLFNQNVSAKYRFLREKRDTEEDEAIKNLKDIKQKRNVLAKKE